MTSDLNPCPAEETYLRSFEKIVRRFPDRTAFRQKTAEGYRSLRYREVHRDARLLASALLGRGIKPGDRVAILSENRPEWVVAYFGILFAGGTVVPLDAQISPEEWHRLLEDSESRAVFVSGPLCARLQEALGGSELRLECICLDPIPEDRPGGATLAGLLETADPSENLRAPEPSDVCLMIYTSGTTGRPKGVMLTHANVQAELSSLLAIIHVDEQDTLLCLLPLQHVFASVINVLAPLKVGAQVVFIDTLKRAEILEALEQAGVTILATVPQFFYLFHARIEDELRRRPRAVRWLFRALLRFNHAARGIGVNLGRSLFGDIHRSFGRRLRLFVSGGSTLDLKVARDFHDLGFVILQGYGLTETTGGCTATRLQDNVLGSVGKPIPGVEVRIADPDELGVGEVAVRGPIVMKGYYRNPEATMEAIREGWFFSGDLGRFDPRGNLHITGRRKEVIVLPSGKNIYPDELEAHYSQCPYIQEIAVLGIRSQGGYQTSERLHAVVVPNFEYLKQKKIANAKEILRDEIGRWSIHLPKYKRLMSYQIQKEPLPRTTTRKIKRLELKRLIEGGMLSETGSREEDTALAPEERALMGSPSGRLVTQTLKEKYRRDREIHPRLNLELDLGFDSMERVEFLASLEQALDIPLPENLGAEVFTVKDLVERLEQVARETGSESATGRQTWSDILSEKGCDPEIEATVRFAGPLLSLVKFLGLKVLYGLFRVLLRMEVRGKENLPQQGAYLLCPNHLSYIDAFVVLSALPYRLVRRVFFVGASEFFDTWFTLFLARLADVIPVDPDVNLLRAMKVGAIGLRRERVLCIFPEGARAFDGETKEFKKGAAILSRELDVPVIPVAIRGTFEVWPRDSWRIRLHPVSLEFGVPLFPAPSEEKDPYQADTDRLRRTVVQMVGSPDRRS